MVAQRAKALVLVGSLHIDGKPARYGAAIAQGLDEHGLDAHLFALSEHAIADCNDCGACRHTGICVIRDAYDELSERMESCDVFVLVAPVYFAGPSGTLKSALDRCQMFWARRYILHERVLPKRPAHLVVIGDGGDPFGTQPLETICTSALNCANLRIVPERIHRLIGVPFDSRRAAMLVEKVTDSARDAHSARDEHSAKSS